MFFFLNLDLSQDPRVLFCLYFVKNDLRHSGRTEITSIAVRGLALVPKDQTFMK